VVGLRAALVLERAREREHRRLAQQLSSQIGVPAAYAGEDRGLGLLVDGLRALDRQRHAQAGGSLAKHLEHEVDRVGTVAAMAAVQPSGDRNAVPLFPGTQRSGRHAGLLRDVAYRQRCRRLFIPDGNLLMLSR
jgi:hypothetical protein